MSIAKNIRTFRKREGMTQIDLANALGISIATLRRWEAGETGPTATGIAELSRVLGVPATDIIADSRNDPKTNSLTSSSGSSEGMLVFENGDLRVELPPTDKGYEIFNKLVEKYYISKE